ncbi:MAG: DUF2149 domain-containing protein, partial [Eggerthellaceae bacterium]|nr:DUF2149 domain-containing protein [Eggerthellaceae bacterium]
SSVNNAFIEQEEADPRTGLVNLADVMLVFACGLMVALVVNYGVDLGTYSEVDIEGTPTEITQDELNAMEDAIENGSGNNWNERGIVYEDPTTGHLYLIEEVQDQGDETDEAAEATAE